MASCRVIRPETRFDPESAAILSAPLKMLGTGLIGSSSTVSLAKFRDLFH